MLAPPSPDTAVFTLTVHGRPAPQGSKKAFNHHTTGKVITQEMSKHVKPWREDVRADAEKWIASNPGLYPLGGGVIVDMVFSITRPKGHYRTGRNEGVLKGWAESARPTGAPDLSKLARSTEDALTSAGVWRDDARVVEYGRLAKVYCGAPEDPNALTVPGAMIRVRPLEVT